jgi:hypothetical protein
MNPTPTPRTAGNAEGAGGLRARHRQRGGHSFARKFFGAAHNTPSDFSGDGMDPRRLRCGTAGRAARHKGRAIQLNDISLLRSSDDAEIMVATLRSRCAGAGAGGSNPAPVLGAKAQRMDDSL